MPATPSPRDLMVEALYLNSILNTLEEPEIDLILDGATLVEFAAGEQIYRADEAIEHAFFPIDCVLSLTTKLKDGSQFEVGSFGREGFSGVFLIFGATRSPNDCYCQVAGTAIKIDGARLQSLRASSNARERFALYARAYVHNVSQLAACSGLHDARERFSRWLLTTHDRMNSPCVRVTHERLVMVLGLTHAEATTTVEAFRNAGLVSYADGILTVLDRAGLESAACDCYSIARAQLEPSGHRADTWLSTVPFSRN